MKEIFEVKVSRKMNYFDMSGNEIVLTGYANFLMLWQAEKFIETLKNDPSVVDYIGPRLTYFDPDDSRLPVVLKLSGNMRTIDIERHEINDEE